MKRFQQIKGNNLKRPKPRRKKRFSSLTFFFLLIIIFMVSTGISYIYFKPILAFKPSTIKKGIDKTTKKSDGDTDVRTPHRLYKSEIWYDAGLERARTIVTIEDVIRDYIKPYGIKLLDLYMDRQGIVYIDLSDEIRKNFEGDAGKEYSFIAGLYSSIKKSVRNISAIKLLIDGREAESIGGHIDISRPIGGELAIQQ